MRFVHSLNTRPVFIPHMYGVPIYFRLVGTLICSAMSVAWIKLRGHDIVLHTDDIGKELMSLIPYDDVYDTVNDIPDTVHPRYWASSKVFAMEKESLDSIHIDNDVFIKRIRAFELINDMKCDLLVQEKEEADNYGTWSVMYHKYPDFVRNMSIDLDMKGAWNTGIMRFGNQELKDRYIQGYKDIITYYSMNHPDELDNDDVLIPDLIAEQTHLYQISQGYDVKCLLDRSIPNFAHDIGYQHLLTVFKYTKLEKIMGMLEQVNPDLYVKIYDMCRTISEEGVFMGKDLEMEMTNIND